MHYLIQLRPGGYKLKEQLYLLMVPAMYDEDSGSFLLMLAGLRPGCTCLVQGERIQKRGTDIEVTSLGKFIHPSNFFEPYAPSKPFLGLVPYDDGQHWPQRDVWDLMKPALVSAFMDDWRFVLRQVPKDLNYLKSFLDQVESRYGFRPKIDPPKEVQEKNRFNTVIDI